MKIENTKEELEKIRWKVTNNQTDFSKAEILCLAAVYTEIQEAIGKKPKPFDVTCTSCIKTAAGVVKNFILYHEEKQVSAPTKAVITKTVIKEPTPDESIDISTMKYQDLRKLAVKEGYQGPNYHKTLLIEYLTNL